MGPGGKPLALDVLSAGATVVAGIYHLPDAPAAFLMALGAVEVPEGGYKAGDEIDVGDLIMLKCADSSEDGCSVTVNDDDSFTTTGTILVVAIGGMFPTPPPSVAEVTAKALNIAMAIRMPTDAQDDNGVPTGAAVKRSTEAAGGETKITLSSSVNDDIDPAYAMSEDMSPPAIMDWHGQTHMRGGEEDVPVEVVNIYTDIQLAEGKKLAYAPAPDGSPIPPPGLSSVIVLADSDDVSYTGYGDDAEQDDETVMGTYNGIPGTFTCTTGTCTVGFFTTPAPGVDPGTAETWVGGWAFESTDDVESQAVQKMDHLYFGYWLQMPADADGDHGFATFSGGGMPFDGTIGDLLGEATYNGAAGGKYVTKELALVEGKVETASAVGGYFTADATLTAVFGDAILMDGRNKISGTIDNFKDGATGEDLGFTVNLTAIDIMDGGPSYTSETVTAAHGTVLNTDGGWNVSFFGPAETVNDTDTMEDETKTTLPTGVAGDFNAEFPDADVAGGFAATK